MVGIAMRRVVAEQALDAAGVSCEVVAALCRWRPSVADLLYARVGTPEFDAFLALQRIVRRQMLRRRWRGVARAIGPLLALQRRAAERAYAPGGAGHREAATSFAVASHLTATAKSGAQNF